MLPEPRTLVLILNRTIILIAALTYLAVLKYSLDFGVTVPSDNEPLPAFVKIGLYIAATLIASIPIFVVNRYLLRQKPLALGITCAILASWAFSMLRGGPYAMLNPSYGALGTAESLIAMVAFTSIPLSLGYLLKNSHTTEGTDLVQKAKPDNA